MKRSSGIAVCGVALLVALGSTIGSDNGRGAVTAGAKCDCTSFPWAPPECAKTCTNRVASKNSTTIERITGLDSSDVIELKKAPKNGVEPFLKSDAGRRFIKSIEKLPQSDLETLTKPTAADGAVHKAAAPPE
jgi:hypothetical protein